MAVLTYYVNANTGSDSNDGSSGSPWLTIAYAVANADWATADALIFHLTGDFTTTAVWDATLPNANPIPFTFTADSIDDASITHNHATSGFWGNWAYRRCRFHCLTMNFASTGQPGLNFTAQNCRLVHTYTSGGYMINGLGPMRLTQCDLVGKDSFGSFLNIGEDSTLRNCSIEGFRFINCVNTGEVGFSNCRFINCGNTAYQVIRMDHQTTGSKELTYEVSNCSFIECGVGAHSLILECNCGATITNNVFTVPVSGATRPLFASTELYAADRNFIYGGAGIGTYLSTLPTSLVTNTTLSSDPYPNWATDDWTVSSELAALADTYGVLPGAPQKVGASGGGSRQVNIRGGADQ